MADSPKFFSRLEGVFGRTFLLYLGLTYFGLKGIVLTMTQSVMLPYMQNMRASGTIFQLATMVSMIPWSMKGWVGVLSDCVPLGTYHKRGYLLLSSVVGIFGLGVLTWADTEDYSVWSIAVLFCLINTMLSTFDLLCEGKYSELMREKSAGPEVLTLVWSCVQMGALCGALVIGAFVDRQGPKPILAACIPLVALAVWRTWAGDLPEAPARTWRSLRTKMASEPRLFILATAMAAGSLLVAVSAALLDERTRSVVSLTVAGVLIWYSFLALPVTLAKANLYMFLVQVAYVNVTGPLAYFYTGSAGCIENAPHFSYSYYLAVSNVVGSLGAALGAVLFQYMQSWQFRTAFVVTTLIQIVATFFDVMIIERWNIDVGLTDQATYLFGDAACQSIAAMMALMPMALLTARLCPRGAEATVFAILAGFQNFGSAISTIFGVQLAAAFGVVASKDGPCNFEHLSSLVILSHCISPLLCLPLTWCLVPAAAIQDQEAFQAYSPAPSFCSPANSPASSPGNSPRLSVQNLESDDEAEYCLMNDDGVMNRLMSEDVPMPWSGANAGR